MTSTPQPKRSKFLLPLLTALVVLTAALAIQQARLSSPQAAAASEPAPATQPEKDAPDFELQTLSGEPYRLSQDPNRVVVLDFWATWCPPCIKGLPMLQATADWAKKENLKVSFRPINYAVGFDPDSPDEVRAFWSKHQLRMPVALDPKGEAGQPYEVTGIPTTIVIVDGKIAKSFVGLSPTIEDDLRAAIIDGLKKIDASKKQAPQSDK